MRLLSRVGTAALVLAVGLFVSAFTLSAFPRTVTGVVVLLGVGFPICLIGEALGELAVSDRPRTWYVRAGGLFGLVALLAVLWWWCTTHASFVHRHFLG